MNSTKYYLGIDTSTTNCSVALFTDEEITDFAEVNDGYSHMEHLANQTNSMLDRNKISVNDLAGVGVGIGPGSYTGLRIGVSFIKGLALVHNLPIVTFTSLELMMHTDAVAKCLKPNAIFVPMIDARRMEVYCQVYNNNHKPLSKVNAEILTQESFSDFINDSSRFYFFGPGAEKLLKVQNSSKIEFISDVFPSSKNMYSLIETKLLNNEQVDLAYFEPFYLKEFVAGTPKSVILSPE